ncbi:dihydrolipoyl dehydrogenase family protein [Lactococcus kimchii]|uniref:dihydrolipoyl dehydrogenase family protein n=1 Tax=Lactococcus sp. S-13 TaxID=2507158 RepID=UPI001022F511|nr:NAD(P)/FAD-dependent oxidoreductase [Lactococcus sp. S-13]RZI48366.1 NAD(P)/FAD-dependent oxidoreductase [Lactococcus sp. S-13]
MENFDVIIIGSGPAGAAMASGLASQGKKVGLVERDKWGGTCPNYGCDPTKIMMSAVETLNHAKDMKLSGVHGELKLDWSELMARKNAYTSPFSDNYKGQLDKSKNITALTGTATFTVDKKLQVGHHVYSAAHYIIATGQKPSYPKFLGNEFFNTSNDFLSLEKLPASMIILGTGYVALELAQIATAAGSKVTLVARRKRHINGFDDELAQAFLKQIESAGIEIVEDFVTEKAEKTGEGYQILSSDGRKLTAAYLLVATGRIPAIEHLGLENVGVQTTSHGIVANKFLQTSNPKIYAIGDVLDKTQPRLTPVAGYEARYLLKNLYAKNPNPISHPATPSLIFGSSKLAQIGSTEGKTQVLDMTNWYTYKRVADPKALAKVTTNAKGQIIGATVLSTLADEIINYLAFLINQKIDAKDIQNQILAYPTAASDLQYLY